MSSEAIGSGGTPQAADRPSRIDADDFELFTLAPGFAQDVDRRLDALGA